MPFGKGSLALIGIPNASAQRVSIDSDNWRTIYYDADGNYCGYSFSKQTKDFSYRDTGLHTYVSGHAYTPSNYSYTTVATREKRENLRLETTYYNVNGDYCGYSISEKPHNEPAWQTTYTTINEIIARNRKEEEWQKFNQKLAVQQANEKRLKAEQKRIYSERYERERPEREARKKAAQEEKEKIEQEKSIAQATVTIPQLKEIYLSKACFFNASNKIFASNNREQVIQRLKNKAINNPNGASSKTLQHFGFQWPRWSHPSPTNRAGDLIDSSYHMI